MISFEELATVINSYKKFVRNLVKNGEVLDSIVIQAIMVNQIPV